jgi:hypothetical protein
MPTQAHRKSRFWRKCRIYFRRFRLVVWLITLAGLSVLIYLNLVGLPDFLKRPLVARLAERGMALEFAALKLHWSRGFVAEQVRFGSSAATNDPALPRLTAHEVEFNLKLRALATARLQLESVALRGGKLVWTLAESNAAPRQLQIENIETSIRLLPGDLWKLDDFRARFGGAEFFVTGTLSNGPAIREWKFEGADKGGRGLERLRKLADTLEQIKFAAPPEIRLDLNGDARDRGSFDALFSVKAAAADTAWGRGKQALLTTRLFPARSNELSRMEISLQAQQVETRWATTTNLDVKLRLVTDAEHPDLVDAAATVRVDGAESPWAQVKGAQVKATWRHATTNPVPRDAKVELHADSAVTFMTRLVNVDFSGTFSCPIQPPAPDGALGFWNHLLPYQLTWSGRVGAVRSLFLAADQVTTEGEWTPPDFSVASFRAQLYRGTVAADARVNVASRAFTGRVATDFDLHRIAPLLPRAAQMELRRLTWAVPPVADCAFALTLPEWTNPAPDWQEIRPTLQLAGAVAVTNGTYQDIHADWVTTHFSYTNLTWQLPDLEIGRPEGGLRVSHVANDRTRDYYFKLHSTIDPQVVLPLLGPEVRRGFDLCEFGQPPEVAGEIWGRWFEPENIGFRGRVALTNFAFRGEQFDAIVAGLNYSNRVVECLEPRLYRGTQHISADGICVDLNTHRTHFTNGFGTFDPAVIVRAIGPVVEHVMAPYHFQTPPTARFNGYVPMGNPHDADVVFEGSGEAFESLNFQATNYTARIIWKNNLLTVTNAAGDLYGGKAAGWAHFVFPDLEHAQYTFGVNITNARLPALVTAVTRKLNNLDGLLTGQLVITNAWTDNIRSWHGYGHAILRDGLLWELPIFGVLSKPLDNLMPGVGNSRFTEAAATFGIASSIVYSPDLEMRSAAMRLQYRGAVDFDGNLNAKIIAEPLRDTPVVGSVMSTILSPVARLFAYRITGTMHEPKSEPVYIPKLLMVPFSPFQSLGELFSSPAARSNAPSEVGK